MPPQKLLAAVRVDRRVPTPPYLQVREAVRGLIVGGALREGDRLPGYREIALAAGTSLFTVQRAVGDLTREGILTSAQGMGTYVAQRETGAIEVIIPHRGEPPANRSLMGEFFHQLIEGIERGDDAGGRETILSYLHESGFRADEWRNVCRARRTAGLMVYRPAPPLADELRLLAAELPVVTLFNPVPGVACVAGDTEAALREELRTRLAAGKREFVFVSLGETAQDMGARRGFSLHDQMRQAFDGALAEAGVQPAAVMVGLTEAEAQAGLPRLAHGLPPGAVVVATSTGPTRWLRDADARLDKITYTECRTTVPLCPAGTTVIYMGLEILGEAAAKRLRAAENRGDSLVRVAPRFVHREA